MAATLPSDLVIPAPLATYIAAQITTKSGFVASGAAVFDYSDAAQTGGLFVNVPRIAQDTTAAESVDGNASTPTATTAYKEIAPVRNRKRVRAFVDNVPPAIGAANSAALVQSLADSAASYWANDVNLTIVNTMKGLFDASAGILRSTHRKAAAATSGVIVPASFSLVIDAATMLGDNSSDISAIVCHSKVWADLQKESGAKVTYVPVGENMKPLAFYNGKLVVEDDNVPTSGSGTYKTYTTILARPGAIYVAWQRTMYEGSEYQALYPRTIITQRADYAVGIRGCYYNSATSNPADSDLYTATNWTKATAVDKEIGLVALVTNAS